MHSNKHQKLQAWEEVCSLMLPGYEGMEVSDKGDKCKLLQRKWRSLRDSYTRELNAQNQSKSGSARVDRKQYIYFNQLLFLRQSVENRKTKSSLEEDQKSSITGDVDELLDIGVTDILGNAVANGSQISPQPTHSVSQISPQPNCSPKTVSQPIEKFSIRPPTVTSRKRNQEQVAATELKVLRDISKRFCPLSTRGKNPMKAEEDQDRLFLLSLLNDLKRVHEDDKLELKSEMILLIKKWQRVRETQNKSTTFLYNPPNHGINNSGGFSGQTTNLQHINQPSSGMTSSTVLHSTAQSTSLHAGSQKCTVQSPSLLSLPNAISPDLSETSCESLYSDYYK